MRVTGQTRVYAVLGRPVGHSLSPVLHNAWFEALGLDAVYVALDVAPAAAGSLGLTLRTLGLAGANLTVPHKRAVFDALDDLSLTARAIGAVNTVVRDGDRLVGHNTDAEGFCRSVEDEHGPLRGRCAVVLGAGGAARAVVAGLAARGFEELVVLNRSRGRAEEVAASLGASTPARVVAGALTPEDFAAVAPRAQLVVNCTAGGASEAVAALPDRALAADVIWCDLNYWMETPPVVGRHRARGGRVVTGFGMLLHQAALAFTLWTGIEPPLETARAACRT